MPNPDSSTPAERFAGALRQLIFVVATMGGGDRLSSLLITLIVDRLRSIKLSFARIAARVAAGTYAPRTRSAAPPKRPAAPKKPGPETRLPRHVGWLLKTVPLTVQARGQLEFLFQDPEMQALLAAAPKSLGRPLRSLCRLLAIRPPPLVALPAKYSLPRKPRPVREPPVPMYPPLPPNMPAWWRDAPRLTRWPKGCGSRSPPRPRTA